MALLPINFLDEVIIRSPVYPLNDTFTDDDITDLISNDFFMEAIYIASPTLYKECLLYKQGLVKEEKQKQKIINSLLRYYSRMSTRCTPFGLFSTVGVGQFNDLIAAPSVKEDSLFYRHTRFDMYFLQRTANLFLQMPYLARHILFFPNNSIYSANNEIRYIEYTYYNDFRKSKISAIVKNQYVTQVLEHCKQGSTRQGLIKLIVQENIEETIATQFVDDLIASQVLISEFEVATTSNEGYIYQIFNCLENIYARSKDWYPLSILNVLKDCVTDMQSLDQNTHNKVDAYQKIVDKIKLLQPVIAEGKTFHIDSYRLYRPSTIALRQSIKKELAELFQYFLEVSAGEVIISNHLNTFKSKFTNRYDTSVVPLIEVLDSDIGIGYPVNKQKKSSPLVDDIPLGNNSKAAGAQINMSAREKWLLEILKNSENNKQNSIQLADYVPPHKYSLGQDDWQSLPRSVSAIFRTLDDEQQTLFFEFFNGPSAAPLLSRFTYGNKEIRNVVKKIIEHEELVTDNAIYVEIVHLPDDRVSNILMHPPFRKYELPYLAIASTEEDNVIPLDDIHIKVESNEIILFSKARRKRIIPCKTHMHMHSAMNSLPLYHFWGDLQQDYNNRSLNFTVYNLQTLLTFIPRIYYKQTIISAATWNLPKQAIRNLENSKEFSSELITLKAKFDLPDQVLFVDGDNELLVNFSNLRSVQNWLKAIGSKDIIVLKEILWGSSGRFNHQYVATLLNTTPISFPEMPSFEHGMLQRQFGFGSEWLFVKLYCGIGSSDLILSKVILPFIHKITQAGIVAKWFFVKYQDPDYHIRLRFLMTDADKSNDIFELLNSFISSSEYGFLIWKLQPDTYYREIERYGSTSMEICESIFHLDSLFTLSIINYLQNKSNVNLAFLIGMRLVHDLLVGLQLSLDEKINFVNLNKRAYQKEFEANKLSVKRINEKYALLKKDIFQILSSSPEDKEPADYQAVRPLLRQRQELMHDSLAALLLQRNKEQLKVDFFSLTSSLIHMCLNRLITNKERLHELLVYEFLDMYYNTAKKNKNLN